MGRLAAYTLALGALCKDPRSFHGRDLVAALLHREPPHDLEFAYATLAACSSAAHVRRRHIRRLLDIANAASDHSLGNIVFRNMYFYLQSVFVGTLGKLRNVFVHNI